MLRSLLTALVIGFALHPVAAAAQQRGDTLPNQFSPPSIRIGNPRSPIAIPGASDASRAAEREAAAQPQVMLGPPVPLDAPIDRQTYLLGPGDVVTVALIGALNLTHSLTVSPEGTILVPTVGIIDILDLNIDQAQQRVRERVLRYYRSVDVRLNLAQLRTFKVFVVGNVRNPGERSATPATRVSEVIPTADEEGRLARGVVLQRANGDSVPVDLARFLHTGDLSQNPKLRAGDVLLVPAINKTIDAVGRIAYPGTYAYRPGESLRQFLITANGSADLPSGAADSIRILRYSDANSRTTIMLSQAEAFGERGATLLMHPFDAVFVSKIANYKVQARATAMGQVVHPGVYPIIPGVTTITDLVTLAGGFTTEASLAQASLRRLPRITDDDSVGALQAIPPEYLSDRDMRIRIADESGDQSYVAIDFEQLFVAGQKAYDQPLQAGDELYVPRERSEVAVVGAVVRPGIVQYKPGQSIAYFVALAGGYSEQAARKDVVVFKANRGNQVAWSDVDTLDPGDRIVVPFEKPHTTLDRVQTVQLIVTTISGLILTILATKQLF